MSDGELFQVGDHVNCDVDVRDKMTDTLVDPATLRFVLKAPQLSATYEWNGTSWTSSENTVGTPSREGVGKFKLLLKVPFKNSASGSWRIAWATTSNASALGGGAGQKIFRVVDAEALK